MTELKWIKNRKWGSDVEFFVQDETGRIVSAEGFIQGTKDAPFRFDPNNLMFATQLDNVLAEGNIPASVCGYMASSINKLRNYMDSVLKPHGLKTVGLADARIAEEFLQSENAKTFGCDPSYNCWTLKEEVVTPTIPDLRTAGFHIHLGYDNPDPEINIAIARTLDVSLGLASVIIEPKNERKKLGYGKAGNYRNQPHGCEYRTLSSWWARRYSHVDFIADLAENVLVRTFDGTTSDVAKRLSKYTAAGNDVQNIINSHDKAEAKKLYPTLLPPHIFADPKQMYKNHTENYK